LSNLQHHDAITGTSANLVANDFNEKARLGYASVKEMNSNLLKDKLYQEHGFETWNLTSDLDFKEDHYNLSSGYAKDSEFVLVVQNPTSQVRNEWLEI